MGCGLCHGYGNVQVRASIMAALLFAIVSSPQLYSFMQALLGGIFRVATQSGAPTFAGLLLHSVVFGLITFALMKYKKRRSWNRGAY